MDTTDFLQIIYYIGLAVALLISDILWLRVVMIFAQACLLTYGIIESSAILIIGNVIFLTINLVQVIRLIIERRPEQMDLDIFDLYKNLFNEMTRYEFIYFWKHGTVKSAYDREVICRKGKTHDQLSLIIAGKVRVLKNDHMIATLRRGNFIAEMGFITHHAASADVIADGQVTYVSWDRDKIEDITKVYPNTMNNLQLIIGKDLVHKLQDRAV